MPTRVAYRAAENRVGSQRAEAPATSSPGKDTEREWPRALEGTLALYIRAYWADQAIPDGTWQPPTVTMVK